MRNYGKLLKFCFMNLLLFINPNRGFLQGGGTDSGEEDDRLISEYQHRLQSQLTGEIGLLVTAPEVCQEAVRLRRAEQLAVALTYENAEVTVELVDKANLQDPPGTFSRPLFA